MWSAGGRQGEDNRLVFAAGSLKESLTSIGEQFKTDNPGSDIEFPLAGSSDLVAQLTQGALADVFASADAKNMDRAPRRIWRPGAATIVSMLDAKFTGTP